MATVWNDLVLSRVLTFVDARYRSGAELDADLALYEAPRLEVAEVVGQALAPDQVGLPLNDVHLLGVLRKYGAPDPALAAAGRCVVLVLADGRLGLSAGRGAVVESSGKHLALVLAPEAGRYVEAWRLPQVSYLEGGAA